MSARDILAAIERERIAAMGPQPPALTMEQLQRNKAGSQACRFFQGPLSGGPCKECGGEKGAHPRFEDLSKEEIVAKEREIIEGIHAKFRAETEAPGFDPAKRLECEADLTDEEFAESRADARRRLDERGLLDEAAELAEVAELADLEPIAAAEPSEPPPAADALGASTTTLWGKQSPPMGDVPPNPQADAPKHKGKRK
jgi:hypothetical protein